jgi:hypothetical protein
MSSHGPMFPLEIVEIILNYVNFDEFPDVDPVIIDQALGNFALVCKAWMSISRRVFFHIRNASGFYSGYLCDFHSVKLLEYSGIPSENLRMRRLVKVLNHPLCTLHPFVLRMELHAAMWHQREANNAATSRVHWMDPLVGHYDRFISLCSLSLYSFRPSDFDSLLGRMFFDPHSPSTSRLTELQLWSIRFPSYFSFVTLLTSCSALEVLQFDFLVYDRVDDRSTYGDDSESEDGEGDGADAAYNNSEDLVQDADYPLSVLPSSSLLSSSFRMIAFSIKSHGASNTSLFWDWLHHGGFDKIRILEIYRMEADADEITLEMLALMRHVRMLNSVLEYITLHLTAKGCGESH